MRKFKACSYLLTATCLCCTELVAARPVVRVERAAECQDTGELPSDPHRPNSSCIAVCPPERTQDIYLEYCAKNCPVYLRCIAKHLPNGHLADLLFDNTVQCQYPTFYHRLLGFSLCTTICTNDSKFCRTNCPGYQRSCRPTSHSRDGNIPQRTPIIEQHTATSSPVGLQSPSTDLKTPLTPSVEVFSHNDGRIRLALALLSAVFGVSLVVFVIVVCYRCVTQKRRKLTRPTGNGQEDAVTDNNAGRGEMIELTEVRYSHTDDSGASLLNADAVPVQDTEPHRATPFIATYRAHAQPSISTSIDTTTVKSPADQIVSLQSTE